MSNFFIEHYGEKQQMVQLAKEAVELAHVINDFLDGKDTIEHVKEEMADCQNLIEQFEEHWGDAEIFKIKISKQKRQRLRIEDEKNDCL